MKETIMLDRASCMIDKRNIDIFLLDDFAQIETLCRNVYFSANISFIHVFLYH